MADTESNPEYENVFRLLVLLNSSMNFITRRLKELASNKVLTPEYLDKITLLTQEVEKYVNRGNPS
jgi:hypothetical protein